MSKPNPDEILGHLAKDDVAMSNEIDRLKRVKQLMGKNRYDGKYRDQFEDVYEDVLEAKDLIEDEFEDGFQFGDLEDILAAAVPVLKNIYDEFYGTLKNEKEAQAFLKDLVLFIYYEVEESVKFPGFLKGILRLFLRVWAAGKAAKYLKIAFDYANGNITALKDKVQIKVEKYTSKLGF